MESIKLQNTNLSNKSLTFGRKRSVYFKDARRVVNETGRDWAKQLERRVYNENRAITKAQSYLDKLNIGERLFIDFITVGLHEIGVLWRYFSNISADKKHARNYVSHVAKLVRNLQANGI